MSATGPLDWLEFDSFGSTEGKSCSDARRSLSGRPQSLVLLSQRKACLECSSEQLNSTSSDLASLDYSEIPVSARTAAYHLQLETAAFLVHQLTMIDSTDVMAVGQDQRHFFELV